MDSSLWFVIHCEADSSYSVVEETAVICEPSVKIGEKVLFFYGRKEPYEGVVAAMGRDVNAMMKKQHELNAKKPKQDSFVAGRPRKTATVCKEVMKTLVTRSCRSSSKQQDIFSQQSNTGKAYSTLSVEAGTCSSKPSSSSLSPPISQNTRPKQKFNKNKNKILDKLLKDTDESDSSSDISSNCDKSASQLKSGVNLNQSCQLTDKDDSDSSENELTQEEMQLLAKVAKKKKLADINHLFALSKKPAQLLVSFSASEKPGPENSGQKSQEENFVNQIENSIITCPGEHDASRSKSEVPDKESGKHLVCRKYRPKYTKKKFEGEYFLTKSTDPDAVKLHGKYEVYVKSVDLRKIKSVSKTPTEVARLLVPKIFTEKALRECSVTGRPAAGKGKDNATLRPPLDQSAVQAIIEYAQARASKKSWREPSESAIKKAISDVLCERRYFERLAAAATSSKEPYEELQGL